jgi:HSP20 family protein
LYRKLRDFTNAGSVSARRGTARALGGAADDLGRRRRALSHSRRTKAKSYRLIEDEIMTSALSPYRRGVNLFDSLRREMEDLFERMIRDDGGNGQAMAAWAPQVDVEETEKEFLVKADLPGVEPKDVDIRVVDNVLTVRGGKEEKKDERKKAYHRMERFSGQFYRAITLPAGTDADKVNATSANGVITITIPKRPEAQPKKIAIQPKT